MVLLILQNLNKKKYTGKELWHEAIKGSSQKEKKGKLSNLLLREETNNARMKSARGWEGIWN